MADGVSTLQAAEVVGGGTFRQAIGITHGDVQGIQHPQAVFQIRHLFGQLLNNRFRQLSLGAPQAVPPALLPLVKMQRFQRLLNGLMGGTAGPFMVTRLRAEDGLGLMQPIRRTIHESILNRLPPPRRAASTRGS